MKKRLLSFGMALCMVLTVMPISAFAEANSEVQTCICEAVCTEGSRNTDCPVCGAEGAALEDCGKYVVPMTEMPTEKANTEATVETEVQTAAATETTAETEVPTETETQPEAPACTCEAVCAAEAMNTDCPICGAEGAALEDCGKYVVPMTEMPTEEANTEAAVETEVPTETESQSELLVCTCEAACTTNVMNTDCPICGAEGATIENCGYVETVSGSDCGYVCEICNAEKEPEQTAVEKVQAMIDALPDAESVTEESRATVEAELDAIDEAKSELSDEERVELDFTRYDAVITVLNELDNIGGAEVSVTVEEKCVGDFTVKGGTLGDDYTYENNVLTVKKATELTIKNTENSATTDRIVLEDGANVILAGVNIDVSSIADCNALCVNSGTVTITLADGTENFLKSGTNRAGLCVENDKNVTIKGNGRLEATGGVNGAGIGSSYLETSGTITISGGSIIATGGTGGAGIGGGCLGRVNGIITISGGSITATGNSGGAGIGGGDGASCGNVKITGGTIKAVAGGEGAKEIGAGKDGRSNGTVLDADGDNVYLCTIDNQNGEGIIIDGKVYKPYNHTAVDSTDANLYAYLTGTDHEVQIGSSTYTYTFDSSTSTFSRGTSSTVTQGTDFVISAKNSGDTLAYVTDYTYQNGVLTINSDKEVTICMKDGVRQTTDTIAVADGVSAKITLAGDVVMGGAMTVKGMALIYTGGYTLTNNNGGTISDSNTITFKTDGAVYAYEVISGSNKSYQINDPSKTGYNFGGWYQGDTEYGFGSTLSSSITLEANWTAKGGYNVDFDSNQGTVVPAKISIKWTDKVLEGVSDPERTGYEFDCWTFEGQSVTADTIYGDLVPYDSVINITLEAQWIDNTAPTGEIKIGDNSWKSFLNSITFGLFFKDTQNVTITATDNSGETVKIEYLLSDKELTAEELAGKTFTAYTGKFNVEPDNEYVIYVKLTDSSGNVAYINSNGIVLDSVVPVISGITNGKTYCEAQTVTVTEKYVDTVTVNGKTVTLDANGKFTLSPAEGTQTVVVIDKAGNSASITVTVNDSHIGGTADCTHKAVCSICNNEYGNTNTDNHTGTKEWTVKNETQHEQKWNCCGTTVVSLEDHEWKDGVCDECGYICQHADITPKDHKCDACKVKLSECADTDDDHYCDYCNDKITACVDNDSNHQCDICKKKLSEHSGGTEIKNDKDATCTEDGYTGDTYCKDCGEKLADGKSIAKTGHNYESKVTKEATTTSTGTKTYTCKNCGDSYTEEIAKLPSDTTSPKTGDETPLVATVVVTLLSAMAVIGLIIYKKRGKYSAK